jgi:hypothetical protein
LNLALNKKMLRLVSLLAVGVLAVGLSGCSLDNRTVETGVSQEELSAGGEPYFNVGPVTYQVQVSRQINPFDPVDVQYFAGVQNAQTLPGNQFWYGVFMWAKNQTGVDRETTDSFKLVDSEGRVFTPTQLNTSINPYAWTAQKLSPDGIEPLAGTTASNGSTGGGLVLFELPEAVYSNRPLTLLIYPYGSTTPSRVSLDL